MKRAKKWPEKKQRTNRNHEKWLLFQKYCYLHCRDHNKIRKLASLRMRVCRCMLLTKFFILCVCCCFCVFFLLVVAQHIIDLNLLVYLQSKFRQCVHIFLAFISVHEIPCHIILYDTLVPFFFLFCSLVCLFIGRANWQKKTNRILHGILCIYRFWWSQVILCMCFMNGKVRWHLWRKKTHTHTVESQWGKPFWFVFHVRCLGKIAVEAPIRVFFSALITKMYASLF